MFADGRSRRVLFTAHCLLNQNAISDGTADYPGANGEIVRALLEAGVGIVQMPCPELCCLGLDRGDIHGGERPVVEENTRIRREMTTPASMETLLRLVEHVLYQITQYRQNGFEIVGIIGSNRSPSCGVDTTSDNDREIEGQGVFVAELKKALCETGLSVPFLGIKADAESVRKVRELLGLCADDKTAAVVGSDDRAAD